ncbi:MAG: glycosyltransferase [Nitrospiraceae bacterium]
MKVLIVNTDYSEFLGALYRSHPGLEGESYERQLRVRYASLFGVADFYSRNLRDLGHEAYDLYVNNLSLQRAWEHEHRANARKPESARVLTRGVKHAMDWVERACHPRIRSLAHSAWRRIVSQNDDGRRILKEQIKEYRPDVLLNQAMDGVESEWLVTVKPWVRLLVGQHAATPLADDEDYRCYDLVVSSFQPTVEFFQRKGIPAVLHRLAFDSAALLQEGNLEIVYPVTFVGSLSTVHQSRIDWLERLCETVPELRVWGPGVERIPTQSPLRRRHMGIVWGRDMYRILRRSSITLNHHGDVPPFANNCRLFEATGMGAMLITDWKANLQEIFQDGKEVVTYRSTEECAERIRYYLEHDGQRVVIAEAGKARTLRDHTYRKRMQEFVDIVQDRLAA